MNGPFAEIGNGLRCDIPTLVNTRLLVQANSGAGKSWCLRRLLEQTHGHVQHLVIDPEGEYASLRERFDYVLAARQGGDTLAAPHTAGILAERLLELGASAILDIYELKPDERVEFVRLFLEALVDAPKHLWHPALVVVDEAHVYCPEVGQAASADAVKGLCTRGRKRGYCAVLATQRLSKLHKDAAAECGNKLIGRTSLDVDMKRAGDELGFAKAATLQLRDLTSGEFFAFGPALTQTVTRVRVGPVATTHPKAGSHLAAVVPPPTNAVRAVLAKLADLPAEAESRHATEADLRRRIAVLEHELAKARRPAPAIERVEVPVVTQEQLQALAALVEQLDAAAAHADELSDKAVATAAALRGDLAKVHQRPPEPARPAVSVRVEAPRRTVEATLERLQVAVPATPPGLTKPEAKILASVAELEALGLHPADKVMLGLLAGYTNVRSGGFSEPLGRLVAAGLVDAPAPGRIAITAAGHKLIGRVDAPRTSAEMQARILDKLTGPEQKLLRVLIDRYPQPMTKEALAAACDPPYTNIRSGGFSEPLGHLVTLRIVETRGRGIVAASPALFLEAQR